MKYFAIFFLTCVSLSSRAGLPEVKEIKLDNGLKVLLAPSSRVPTLTQFTFFKVGSRNEKPGITGVSHFMEHMMFNGAKKYGPKLFDLTMERAGGANNAFTANDMTAYNDDIPSAFLETNIDMEVDRLKDILLDPKLFDSERHVVMEERRLRSEDDPDGFMEESLFAAAFKASPYHWPVVGWMKDLEAIKRDEAYAYIKTYYAPNNATLILSGDFDSVAAEKMIRARYSEVTSQVQPPAPVLAEPEQRGAIRIELYKDVEAPAIMRGYKVPAITDADTPAVDVMAEILGGGEQALLTEALVHQAQLATDVSVRAPDMKDPSLLEIVAHLRPGVDPAKAKALIDETLAKFVTTGADAANLKRAQARLAVQYLRQLETNNGFASAIGQADVLYGDWREAFKFKEKIDAVTVADVGRVGKKYLNPMGMTEVTLIPQAAEPEPAPVVVPAPAPVKKAK